VDTVEVALMPILLGAGIPLLPPGGATKLVLNDHKVLPASGIVVLAYSVAGTKGSAPPIRYIRPAKQKKAKQQGKKRGARATPKRVAAKRRSRRSSAS
jgi:hypothetical protein